MRNCQQNECLKRDQVDPLYPRQTQDPCLLPPWRQGHFLAEARRLNLGMWVRRGWNCFGWPNLGHTLFCLEATEGLRPWALLKGNKHRPRTQICVSKWLQQEACTFQSGLCPVTCTITMIFQGSFPGVAG